MSPGITCRNSVLLLNIGTTGRAQGSLPVSGKGRSREEASLGRRGDGTGEEEVRAPGVVEEKEDRY